MNLWQILGAVIFALIFVTFAFWGAEPAKSFAVQGGVAAFLFAFYCGLVIFGTSDKKRTLSLFSQTFLGILLSLAIAALFGAPPKGYAIALLVGLVLGYTSDLWAKHIQLP